MLAEGFTYDGIEYDISWIKNPGKLQIEFLDDYKEVWDFLDVQVECDNKELMQEFLNLPNSGCAVYIGTEIWGSFRSFNEALRVLTSRQEIGSIGYRLEHEGSWIVRGRNVQQQGEAESVNIVKVQARPTSLPFGRTRLVFQAKSSKSPVVREAQQMRRQHEGLVGEGEGPPEGRAPQTPQKPLPSLKAAMKETNIGLGRDGMQRLKSLLDSTLAGLGIKASTNVRVQGVQVIYQLESKYKGSSREDAIERASLELLKWIETHIYFAG